MSAFVLACVLLGSAAASSAAEADAARAGAASAFEALGAAAILAPTAVSRSAKRGPSDAELAFHYAPTLYQDLNSSFPRSIGDLPMRFDYDGDWLGSNNWENLHKVMAWQRQGRILPEGGNPLGYDLGAYLYYAVVESARHWFITYAVFHPQDWSDDFFQNRDSQHENDMEGAVLTVEKDGSRFGRPLVLMTQAHGHFFLYSASAGIRPAKSAGRGTLLFDGDRPRIYAECEGHGIAAGKEQRDIKYGRVSLMPQKMKRVHLGAGGPTKDFAGGDGLVFVPAGKAEYAWARGSGRNAKDPERRTVGYALLPLDELWARRRAPETMMRFESFRGTRFDSAAAIGSAFNDERAGSANPPWGWSGKDSSAGELFFDPAWVVSRHFDFTGHPGGFDPAPDGRYERNPYLEAIGARFLGTP